ncbi:MAG: Uma2 family endonuclease [Acidobacteria bacterium]|nr:Uma2 family endonuclease [Acidobacteriota bacterium]
MPSAPRTPLSPEEYVALEEKLGVKHEYHDGQMFAMSGASGPHSLLQMALAALVYTRLGEGSCKAYGNDFRVVIEAAEWQHTRICPLSAET